MFTLDFQDKRGKKNKNSHWRYLKIIHPAVLKKQQELQISLSTQLDKHPFPTPLSQQTLWIYPLFLSTEVKENSNKKLIYIYFRMLHQNSLRKNLVIELCIYVNEMKAFSVKI